MFRVSYSREYDTNLYRVTFHQLGQTIVVPHGVLVKKISMDPRCSVGCKDLLINEILDLGFVFPDNNNRLVV